MSSNLSLKMAKVREMVKELNRHRHLYYNENTPAISDFTLVSSKNTKRFGSISFIFYAHSKRSF